MADNNRSGNQEQRSEAGRKCGEEVGRDREHMSEIGRKGGEARGEQQKDRDR